MTEGEQNIEYLVGEDGVEFDDDVQTAHLMVVGELMERIERAKAMLSYFGTQGDSILAVLDGRDAPDL